MTTRHVALRTPSEHVASQPFVSTNGLLGRRLRIPPLSQAARRRDSAGNVDSDPPPNCIRALFQRESLLWHPLSLKFESPVVEATFLESCLPWWMLQDSVTYTMALVFVPALFAAIGFHKLPPLCLVFVGFLMVVYFPGIIYLYIFRRDLCRRWRRWSLPFTRICVYAAFCTAALYMEAPSPTVPAVLKAYLAESPIHSMCFMSIANRVQFRYHLLLQLIQTFMALYWIPSFCQTCSTDPTLQELFQQMGYGMDCVCFSLASGAEPVPKNYPCWMVTGFAVTVLGFILPSLFVFLLEIWARHAYALGKIVKTPRNSDALTAHFHDLKRTAVIATFTLTLVAWLSLAFLRDVSFVQPFIHQGWKL